MNARDPAADVPDRPEIRCPWCGAPILLSRFAASDEEAGTDVAVCPGCVQRVPLALPLTD